MDADFAGSVACGRQLADRYTMPLSTKAYRELHAAGDEEAWLAVRGIDGWALAAARWRASGEFEAGGGS